MDRRDVFAGVCAAICVAIVYVFSIRDLDARGDVCRSHEISTLVDAVVVANHGGNVTYALSERQNCSVLIVGGSTLQPGEDASIWRSDDGECALEKHDSECTKPLFTFSLIYTLFGAPVTWAIVFICIQASYKHSAVPVVRTFVVNDAETVVDEPV